ncbi:MAG: PAS domain-containing protein, partial [Flavitalea sp.]
MGKRHSTIQAKLMRVIMLTSGAVLLMACAAFFTFEYITGHEVKKRQLRTLGEILATSSVDALTFNKQSNAQDLLNTLRSQENIVGACLYDPDGNIFAVYPVKYSPPANLPAINRSEYHFKEGFLEGYQPVIEHGETIGMLYLRSDMEDVHTKFMLYGGIAVVSISISFITAFLFKKYFQHSITAPILDLAQAARTVSDNRDYSVRTKKITEDEVGDLTDAFNHMLIEIERQNDEIHILNHDLELKVKERTSELQQANFVLQQQTELVGNIIDSSVDLIAVFDSELRYRVLNKESEKIYGNNANLIGKIVYEVFPNVKTSGMLDALQKAFLGETLKIAHYKSGITNRFYEHFYIPIKDKDNKVYLVLTVAHDITDIMEVNEKLQQVNRELAKSNEELEQFAYIASHDLQEPL